MRIFFLRLLIALLSLNIYPWHSYAADGSQTSQNLVVTNPQTLQSSGDTQNQSDLANSLCTLIMILNGRIARVLSAVAIFVIGILFFLGKITWPIIVTIGIAFGLVFGAKAVAILLLPRAISSYDATQKETLTQTPSEIISQACPELL